MELREMTVETMNKRGVHASTTVQRTCESTGSQRRLHNGWTNPDKPQSKSNRGRLPATVGDIHRTFPSHPCDNQTWKQTLGPQAQNLPTGHPLTRRSCTEPRLRP